jgi:hypothetical protein
VLEQVLGEETSHHQMIRPELLRQQCLPQSRLEPKDLKYCLPPRILKPSLHPKDFRQHYSPQNPPE